MDKATTLNANVSECLKTVTNIGYQRIHNICSGAINDVPWGTGDWILAVMLAVLLVFLVLIIVGFGKLVLEV